MKNKLKSEKYMSVIDAAKILNVHFRTIYTLIYTGRLGHMRVGRVFRISQAQLDEYIKGETEERWS